MDVLSTPLLDRIAVTLPASGAVIEGLLKILDGQLFTSNDGHILEEVDLVLYCLDA